MLESKVDEPAETRIDIPVDPVNTSSANINNALSSDCDGLARNESGWSLKSNSSIVGRAKAWRTLVQSKTESRVEIEKENSELRRKSLANEEALFAERLAVIQREEEIKNLLRSNELNKYVIIWSLILIGILVVSQIVTAWLIVGHYSYTTVNKHGQLTTTSSAEGGSGSLVYTGSSDFCTNDGNGLINKGSFEVIGTSNYLLMAVLSSCYPDYSFDRLPFVTLVSKEENITLRYNTLNYYRSGGIGMYGSIMTVSTTGGTFYLNGYNVMLDGNLTYALCKASKATAASCLYSRSRTILNGSFTLNGHFDLSSESILSDCGPSYPMPYFPAFYKLKLKEYRQCNVGGEAWLNEWCASSSVTVTHPDFPDVYWFSSDQQWTYSSGGIFQKITTFAPGESDQIQYFTSFAELDSTVSLITTRNSINGNIEPQTCTQTFYNPFGTNLITYLMNSDISHEGISIVNSESVYKYAIRYYDVKYDDFMTYNWYAKMSTGLVVRLELSPASANNTAVGNPFSGFSYHSGKSFYEISEVESLDSEKLLTDVWWDSSVHYPVCDLICPNCNNTLKAYHAFAPLENTDDATFAADDNVTSSEDVTSDIGNLAGFSNIHSDGSHESIQSVNTAVCKTLSYSVTSRTNVMYNQFGFIPLFTFQQNCNDSSSTYPQMGYFSLTATSSLATVNIPTLYSVPIKVLSGASGTVYLKYSRNAAVTSSWVPPVIEMGYYNQAIIQCQGDTFDNVCPTGFDRVNLTSYVSAGKNKKFFSSSFGNFTSNYIQILSNASTSYPSGNFLMTASLTYGTYRGTPVVRMLYKQQWTTTYAGFASVTLLDYWTTFSWSS